LILKKMRNNRAAHPRSQNSLNKIFFKKLWLEG